MTPERALEIVTKLVDGVGTTLYAYVGSCSKVQSVDGPFANDTITYGYDAGKRLTSVTYASSVVNYSFDALDRIVAVISAGKTNAYTYVANGRLVDNLTLGNGVVSEYSYDPRNRLTNLVHQSGGTSIASFAYTYNAVDQRTSVIRGGSGSTPTTINYGYDPIGQLTSAQGDFPGYDFDYAFDPAGNPTRQNNNGFVMSNAFNNLNQNITSLWSGALTVLGLANDIDGDVEVNGVAAALRAADGHVIFVATNLPVVTGTNTYTAIHTDPLSRTATSTVSAVARNRGYGYDANGNMTNDGQFVYVWDDADRLKEVRKDGEVVMTCLYDGLGRRRERVMNGETNRYVYHDWAVIEVHDGDDNVLETYTHGPDLSGTLGGAGGIGGILHVAPLSGGAGGGYFHYDANGNVVRLTDANCEIVSSLEYGPFGTVLLQSGSYTPRYQFSSKEFDSTVGLNYYGYRFYSPGLGRWISPDPLGDHAFLMQAMRGKSKRHRRELFKASLDPRYVFVSNEPLSRIDPLGLTDWPWPLNSRVCNNSSDQCLIVWNDKTGYSVLKPGECTSFWRDRGDFAYWNGDWFKCGGGKTCSIDDRPIDDYPDDPGYLPPVDEDDNPNNWHPGPPGKDLCQQYCDCNADSSHSGEMKDQCDCVDKCMGK